MSIDVIGNAQLLFGSQLSQSEPFYSLSKYTVVASIGGQIIPLYYYKGGIKTPVLDKGFDGGMLGPEAAEVTGVNQLTVIFRTKSDTYVSGNYGWITIGRFDLNTGLLTSFYNFGTQKFDTISSDDPRLDGPYLNDNNYNPYMPTYTCVYDLKAPSDPANKAYFDVIQKFSSVLNPTSYTIVSTVNNSVVASVDEGSTVVFKISTANVPTGTSVNYKLSGDVNAADFVAGTRLTGTGKIDSNGMLNISFQIANDKKTEGAKQLKFQLFNSNNAQLGDTVSLTVNDTSKAPPPTFVITPSKSVLNEGDTLTTTITTSNITPGTLYWKVSGLVTANDFSSGSLSGSLKVRDGGSYKLTHILKNDYLTEDSENLTVSLFTDSAFQTVLTTSSTVTINDTSTDTLISSRTAILPSGQANLTLTGTGNINGTGNDMNNTIIGNTGNNNLAGRKGKDILTGLDGQDTFTVSSLADSLLSAYDVITDFTIGEDKIKAPRSYSGKVIASPFNVSDIKPATIQSKLTASAFKANTAAILNSGQQIFLALNDATAGFDPLKDTFIEITGYKSVGNLTIANIGSSIL